MTEATLDGRRVLVVGAGTQPTQDPDAPIGNGRAVAVLAARRGATVLCADRDQEAAAKTAELVEQEGGQAEVLVADVADEDNCRAMVAAAAESGLNGLVLNVGIGRGRGLGETSAKDWDVVLGINLRSHFLCAREALPHMGEGDSMVFIGSTAGLRPGSRLPAYDASKAGLVGLCRHTALEGARQGIRANLVAPGLIDTPLGRLASAGRPSRERTPIPLGRQGSAWEVAEAVVFLLSPASAYVTGVVLPVDGGLCLI